MERSAILNLLWFDFRVITIPSDTEKTDETQKMETDGTTPVEAADAPPAPEGMLLRCLIIFYDQELTTPLFISPPPYFYSGTENGAAPGTDEPMADAPPAAAAGVGTIDLWLGICDLKTLGTWFRRFPIHFFPVSSNFSHCLSDNEAQSPSKDASKDGKEAKEEKKKAKVRSVNLTVESQVSCLTQEQRNRYRFFSIFYAV